MKYITDEMINEVYDKVQDFSIFARLKSDDTVEKAIALEVTEEINDLVEKGVFPKLLKNNKKFISDKKISFPKEFFTEYCIYRELDMRLNDETIEDSMTPTLAELNFKHSVVGSDETGNGEIFKNFVVTAACVRNVDDLRRCIKLGITDSKNYKNSPEIINFIGESITGYNDWSELIENQRELPMKEDREGKDPDDYKLFVEDDFFVSRIITNEELNWRCERNGNKIDNILRDQKEEGHKDVLERLYAKLPKEYQDSIIVIDNIIDVNNNEKLEKEKKDFYKENLSKQITISKEKIYMTPKGDSKIMAVGLAAMISSYFSALGMKYTKNRIAEACKFQEEKLPEMPKGNNQTNEIIRFLEVIKERCEKDVYEEILDLYTKRYYDFKNPRIRELLGLPTKG